MGVASRSSLGFANELVGVVPVLQQVGGLLVVHTDVAVLKQAREEVVDLPGHIQDVAHPAGRTGREKERWVDTIGPFGMSSDQRRLVFPVFPLGRSSKGGGGNATLINITEAQLTALAVPIKSHGHEGWICGVT